MSRNSELAKIHILAEQAGFDTKDKDPDCDYRQLLWTLGRVRSASKLDEYGRRMVIDHLNKGKKQALEAGRPANIESEQFGPMLRKIEKLLLNSNRAWAYADGIAKQMFQIEKLQFCGADHLRAVIAALSKDKQRRGKS